MDMASKEEIVQKLKDDGDFDRLRLKIIRRLKDNEELRNNMISIVKESTALNRPSAQNMKTRQLSDAIFEEVGSKMLSQLSDGLWGIIRSEDGMKNEIRETVQSVYATLSTPVGVQNRSSTRVASHNIQTPVPKGKTSSRPRLDNEPEEPLRFVRPCKQKQELIQKSVEENKVNYIDSNDDEDPELPPGFA
ncbi:hypothetical protein AALP_AA1G136100 [Arabis alpina]|uniref:BOD1/SHG1 domain-containing protein n=1 Tax=Arabis alpina TaxID=50452 RepID=A0A087HN18_ARAAL|nr:hypothetical protein AALP_AA1G136100 [Arabis alpina]